MKFAVLFFLQWLAAVALAYGSYGGYERMYFYYAYLIDQAAHASDGKATIAAGCKNCNFSQFIKYINDLSADPGLTTEQYPDVDKTAQTLDDRGLTGVYNINKIFNGAGSSIPKLFQGVADTTRKNGGGGTSLSNCATAIQRVQFLRTWATSDAISSALQRQFSGIKLSTRTKYISSGGSGYDFLDVGTTANNNPGMDVQGAVNSFRDPSHDDNVKAATASRATIQLCAKK